MSNKVGSLAGVQTNTKGTSVAVVMCETMLSVTVGTNPSQRMILIR
jgi:hypothetical protein